MAQVQNVEGYFSGDDLVLHVSILDEDGAALSIAGASAIEWQLAKKASSPSALITKTLGSGITVTDAATGKLDITIEDTDTAALFTPTGAPYYHELQITDVSGNITTVMYGTFEIKRDKVQ